MNNNGIERLELNNTTQVVTISRLNANNIPIVYKTSVTIVDNKLMLGPFDFEKEEELINCISNENGYRIAIDFSDIGKNLLMIGIGKKVTEVENGNSKSWFVSLEIEEIV